MKTGKIFEPIWEYHKFSRDILKNCYELAEEPFDSQLDESSSSSFSDESIDLIQKLGIKCYKVEGNRGKRCVDDHVLKVDNYLGSININLNLNLKTEESIDDKFEFENELDMAEPVDVLKMYVLRTCLKVASISLEQEDEKNVEGLEEGKNEKVKNVKDDQKWIESFK